MIVCVEAKSDVNDIHADESNFDGDSDNETRTTNTSIKTEIKPTISQGKVFSRFEDKC